MKILFFIPSFSSGGAEAFIINTIESLDKTKFESQLVCIDSKPSVYDDRLRKIGIKIHRLVSQEILNPAKRYIKSYATFHQFLKQHAKEFDIVHFNIAQGEDLPFIWIAQKAGIRSRILHSHNSSVNSFIKYCGHKICKMLFNNSATSYLACSHLAAKWLMPQKVLKNNNFKIIKNGIDVSKYRFDCEIRDVKRKELGVEDRIVLFNIGRLNNQKNQTFLLDVFKLVHEKKPNSVLIVAGDGDLKEELARKTELLGLKESVMWLGNRNDIPELLSAADVFLLPSLFEGLPYTIIEAQASGIKCVISNTISEECVITDLVKREGFNARLFANLTIEQYENNRINREEYAQLIRNAGFDIGNTVKELEEIYIGRTKD